MTSRLFALVVAGFFLNGNQAGAQSSPLDVERPWATERWDYLLRRAPVKGPEVPEKFPKVKVSREVEGEIRAEFPKLGFRDAWPKVQLLSAKNGVISLPDGGGTITVAAVATGFHSGEGRQDRTPKWVDPVSHTSINADELDGWELPEKRAKHRGFWPDQGSQVKWVIRQDGVENLLWLNGSMADGETWIEQSFAGLNPRARAKTAIYDMTGPVWNDGPIRLLLQIAWGKFEQAEGPATPGTTLKIPGAIGGLFALENGQQRGASYGRDDPSYVISRYRETTPDKPGCIGICGFIPYQQGRITDLELEDVHGNIAVSTAWNGSDYVFASLFSGVVAEDVVTFRIKRRPHTAWAIVELPNGLPGMPNRRADCNDGFDQKVPFAKFGKLNKMLSYISRGAQVGELNFTDLAKRQGIQNLKFPRVYRDATLRDMLQDVTDAVGVEIEIEADTFRPLLKDK